MELTLHYRKNGEMEVKTLTFLWNSLLCLIDNLFLE